MNITCSFIKTSSRSDLKVLMQLLVNIILLLQCCTAFKYDRVFILLNTSSSEINVQINTSIVCFDSLLFNSE